MICTYSFPFVSRFSFTSAVASSAFLLASPAASCALSFAFEVNSAALVLASSDPMPTADFAFFVAVSRDALLASLPSLHDGLNYELGPRAKYIHLTSRVALTTKFNAINQLVRDLAINCLNCILNGFCSSLPRG
jgi:hypothetical protein